MPLAAADLGRLREAARLRGPAAAPATRGAIARRLLVGALDRSVDVAATLELRGFGSEARSRAAPLRRSRHDRLFLGAGLAVLVLVAVAGLGGLAEFEPYPRLEIDDGLGTVSFALALPVLAAAPFALARLRSRPTPVRPLRLGPESARG